MEFSKLTDSEKQTLRSMNPGKTDKEIESALNNEEEKAEAFIAAGREVEACR